MLFTARASGASSKEAARAAEVSKTPTHYWLRQSGGVRPRPTRPPLRLSAEEREVVSRGLARKLTLTAIASEPGRAGRSVGRSVSTISPKVRRNSGPNDYRGPR